MACAGELNPARKLAIRLTSLYSHDLDARREPSWKCRRNSAEQFLGSLRVAAYKKPQDHSLRSSWPFLKAVFWATAQAAI